MHKIISLLLLFSSFLFWSCNNKDAETQTKVVLSSVSLEALTYNLVENTGFSQIHRIGGAQGTCDHNRSLSGHDFKEICAAKIVLHNGEEFITEALAKCSQVTSVNVVDKYDSLRYFASGEADMHLWFSPRALSFMVENIFKALSENLALDTLVLQENLAKTLQNIEKLQASLSQLSLRTQEKNVAMFHEAYGYLLRELGMSLSISWGGNEMAPPSAKELANWIKKVESDSVAFIFASPEDAHSQAFTVAQATGIPVLTLNLLTEEWEALQKPSWEVWAGKYLENLRFIEAALDGESP